MRTVCIMGRLGADKSLVCYASGMINAVLRKTHRFQNVCRFHFFNCGSLQRPTDLQWCKCLPTLTPLRGPNQFLHFT